MKVLATPDTELASPDAFYFGNLVGDTGDSDIPTAGATVAGWDSGSTRQQVEAVLS